MSSTEVPTTLPGNVSLADHDPAMYDLIEKEKVSTKLQHALVMFDEIVCITRNTRVQEAEAALQDMQHLRRGLVCTEIRT